MQWYLYRSGAQAGPYLATQLLQWAGEGRLVESDLFCKIGGTWISLADAVVQWQAETLPPPPPIPPILPTVSQTPDAAPQAKSSANLEETMPSSGDIASEISTTAEDVVPQPTNDFMAQTTPSSDTTSPIAEVLPIAASQPQEASSINSAENANPLSIASLLPASDIPPAPDATAPEAQAVPSDVQPNAPIPPPVAPLPFEGNPTIQDSPPPKKKKKKRKGCLGCLITFLISLGIVISLLAGAIFLLTRPQPSKNLKLGNTEKILSQTIAPSGDTLSVNGGGISGATLIIPANAYQKPVRFTLSTTPIISHEFGQNFNPITPLITIDNGHQFANEMMFFKIPIHISADEFAMAFYYDTLSGKLEGIPCTNIQQDSITIATKHFSGVVVTKIRGVALQDLNLSTGFTPGIDDWQFVNYGSYIAPSGHCAGQSISEMWYYLEQKIKGQKPSLFGLYDDNGKFKQTPNFWEDDSWGYRFASTIQKRINWDSASFKSYTALAKLGDDRSFKAFAYSMMLTGRPQFVGIYSVDSTGNIKGGHAIVAYRISGNKIYVADPNYPGKADRSITFDAAKNQFVPYSSGLNATDINNGKDMVFNSIIYYAVSSMIDWNTVGKEYQNLLDGKAGDDYFPEYKLELLKSVNPDTGEETWGDCPDFIQTKLEETAKVAEKYAGMLVFRIKGDTPYQYTTGYEDTSPVTKREALGNNDGEVRYEMKLKKGVTDIGFLQEYNTTSGMQYGDFKRVHVIYDSVDLSGTWKGDMTITDAGPLFDFLADQLGRSWASLKSSLLGEPLDIEKGIKDMRDILTSAKYDKNYKITMTFSKVAPDDELHYNVVANFENSEGEVTTYNTKLTLQDGEIKFHVRDGDGSNMELKCFLLDDNLFEGTFTISAWGGLVPRAIIGDWKITKES